MIAQAFRVIQENIKNAAAGRDVKIIAVTKGVQVERLKEAYDAGIRIFGENRIQEAIPKIESLQDSNMEWHFIGHLQSNKASDAIRYFSTIQSVDSERLLHTLEKHAGKQSKKIPVLLEVNTGGETTKYGLSIDELQPFLQSANGLQWVNVVGLMTIPPFFEDPEKVRPYFQQLRETRDRLRARFPNLRELSMGMSHDYAVAIEEGATMVRIGTALFGL